MLRYRLHFRKNKKRRNLVASNYQDLKHLFTTISLEKGISDKEIQVQGKRNTQWRTCCDGKSKTGCRVCMPIIVSEEMVQKNDMIIGLHDIGDELKLAQWEWRHGS